MRVLSYIDNFLDQITMYRLVLYILIGILAVSIVGSILGFISYSPVSIIISSIFIVLICWAANTLFSFFFDAPANVESFFITALILALIISPANTPESFIFLGWAGILSMASKYILAINKKHIFNPAAIAVVITLYVLGQSASWWVGTTFLAPFVLLGGFLIIRKLHFEDLAWSFYGTFIIVCLGITMYQGGNIVNTLNQLIFHTSLLFMGGIMVTEPLTLPPTKKSQAVFGMIVGFLAVPKVHFGSVYFAPELALCIGNLFAYIVSPKVKLLLSLDKKIFTNTDYVDFLFKPIRKFSYVPGQYMEWTLPHKQSDSRGNRRYFTLASSPTEDTIQLGVKFYKNGSSYKTAMYAMKEGNSIVGAQLAGDFVLPKNADKKLVFIAGGIGITPFRSMLKYLVDMRQQRDITLFYSNRTVDEIMYQDVFEEAENTLSIKTIYTLTDLGRIPKNWKGSTGRINAEMMRSAVPDYIYRMFYLSGPHTMVVAFEEVLRNMGVKSEQIKKDFFPGLV